MLDEARGIAEKQNHWMLDQVLTNLADVYAKTARAPQAEQLLARARALLESSTRPGNARRSLALCASGRGARHHLRRREEVPRGPQAACGSAANRAQTLRRRAILHARPRGTPRPVASLTPEIRRPHGTARRHPARHRRHRPSRSRRGRGPRNPRAGTHVSFRPARALAGNAADRRLAACRGCGSPRRRGGAGARARARVPAAAAAR